MPMREGLLGSGHTAHVRTPTLRRHFAQCRPLYRTALLDGVAPPPHTMSTESVASEIHVHPWSAPSSGPYEVTWSPTRNVRRTPLFSAGSQQTESPAAEPALQVHGVGISRCAVFLLSIPGGLAAKCRAGTDRPAPTQAEASDAATRGPPVADIADDRRSPPVCRAGSPGRPLRHPGGLTCE